MSDLYFNTDQGESTLSTLRACCGNIQTELSRARSSANELVPSNWRANAANEFQGFFDNWASTTQRSVEDLETLCNQLRIEIDKWLAEAEKLG